MKMAKSWILVCWLVVVWSWSVLSPVATAAVFNDYNGDGSSDLAVYDRHTGRWFVKTHDGIALAWGQNWGFFRAVAVPGDYDGDGKADLAVYDTAEFKWYIKSLTKGVLGWGIQWGAYGLVPVPYDFNDDGACDLTLYDTRTGNWYVRGLDGAVLAWEHNWGYVGANPPGAIEIDFIGYDGSLQRPPSEVISDYYGGWYGSTNVVQDGTNCTIEINVRLGPVLSHMSDVRLTETSTGDELWFRMGDEGIDVLSPHSFRADLNHQGPADDYFIAAFKSLIRGSAFYSHVGDSGVTIAIDKIGGEQSNVGTSQRKRN